jgi:hypothetical protein
MTARQRVNTATVFVDVAGNDANDGMSAATPLKTLQRAFDYAAGNFDLEPPFSWTTAYYIGERPGVVIQMAPATAANPYILPIQTFLDGQGISGPITLRGDREHPTNYFIRADASGLQGITAQAGARLYLEGFAIFGAQNTTLINTLSGGQIAIRDVWFGPTTGGAPTSAMGAAGGGQLEVIGTVHFWGGGFGAIMTAIEEGRIILAPNAAFDFTNAMNFGQIIGLQHASLWTQGTPPTFFGAGLPGCSGLKFSVTQNSMMSIFDALNVVPGTGYTLGNASTAYDGSGNPLPPNTAGP